jgi:hypothetical protein
MDNETIYNLFSPVRHCDRHNGEGVHSIEELERVQIVHFDYVPPHVRIIRADGNYLCFIVGAWDGLSSVAKLELLKELSEYTTIEYSHEPVL